MDINNIVEQCLSKIGKKMFQDSMKSKSAISSTKNDLTALINTLKRNVCIYHVFNMEKINAVVKKVAFFNILFTLVPELFLHSLC